MHYISPKNWLSQLAAAVSPQTADGKVKKHSVIVETQGHDYTAVDSEHANEAGRKLSIPDIVKISKLKFEEVKTNYKKNFLNEKEFVNMTNDLSSYTYALIQARESKRNQPLKRFGRGIALVISAVASVFLIGIPFFIMIRNANKQFNAEISQLREEVMASGKQAMIAMAEKKIEHFLSGLPTIINNVKLNCPDDLVTEIVEGQMSDYFKGYQKKSESEKKLPLEQFNVDIRRQNSFIRKDVQKKIQDTHAMPSLKLKGDERVASGVSLLKELIATPQDAPWEIALQLAANQTSLNGALFGFIAEFAGAASKVQWTEDDRNYSIKTVLRDGLPPILLEINRNKETNAIESVNVEVQGVLDIVKFDTGAVDTQFVIKPEAVKVNMKYTMTLGDDNRPLITNLKTVFESPKKSSQGAKAL